MIKTVIRSTWRLANYDTCTNESERKFENHCAVTSRGTRRDGSTTPVAPTALSRTFRALCGK